MANKPPRTNLPPEAEAWGRYVNNELRKIRNDIAYTTTNQSADNAAVASSMAALSVQVANQSYSEVSTESSSNFPLTTTSVRRAQTTINRPDWANSVYVFVTGYLTARMSGSGTGNNLALMSVGASVVGDIFQSGSQTVTCMPHASGEAGLNTMSTGQVSWGYAFNNLSEDVTGVMAYTNGSCYNSSWYPAHLSNYASVNLLSVWLR